MNYSQNPFSALRKLQEDLNSFWWEHSPFYDRSNLSGSNVFPPVNIFERSGETLELQAELPGMQKEHLKLSVRDNILHIEGDRKCYSSDSLQDKSFHRREREDGTFRRSLRLPYKVNPDKVQATMQDGVLTVVMEKAEEAKARQIEIQA